MGRAAPGPAAIAWTAAIALAFASSGPRAGAAEVPREYVVVAVGGDSGLLDGKDTAWAPASSVQWGPPGYETTFHALWTPEALFLRFDARDPSPWHTMTKRDEHLWEEEVVEIFLDLARSGRNYYELEVSPANVVCDVLMIQPSPDKKSDLGWNLAGLETRVVPFHAPGGQKGWTVLAKLPFAGLRTLPSAAAVRLPPQAGDRWRFNVFRIERPGGKGHPEQGAIEAAWSPTGQPSFHVPAAFRDFVFAASAARASGSARP
jgi:cellulose/xylan binding protein with CBM9 domain